jgi:phage tail-like protein
MPERNLLTTSRFLLEIDGIIQAGFSLVKMPEKSIKVIDYRNGNDPPFMRKLPGMTEIGLLTCETGVTTDGASSLELSNWFKDVEDGKIATSRKNISIIVLDEQGDEAVRYNIINAFPSKYTVADLNSKNNEVFIEKLEISAEEWQKVTT